MLTRRFLLSCPAFLGAVSASPRIAFATLPGRPDQRFVLVILRGAMDGLAAVPPIGDPDYAATHGLLAIPASGQEGGALRLDDRFGLHPALAPVAPLYASGEMLCLHALASPYRQRSHFDAQDLLENGTARPGGAADGWVNRTLSALGATRWEALAIGDDIPMALRGKAPVGNWRPGGGPEAGEDVMRAVSAMYAADPALASALRAGIETAAMVAGTAPSAPAPKKQPEFAAIAARAGSLLAADDGPNLAVMEVFGWDTHVGQGAAKGRLALALRQFAGGIADMRAALGPAWARTVVVAVTEFGRTARPNGTDGTDHGTASAAFVVGGPVAGGRVIADWPGLAPAALYQGRDLAPTSDMRALFKAVLGEHLHVPTRLLDTAIFPGSAGVRPMSGLMRA